MLEYLVLSAGMSVLDHPLDRPWWWQQPHYAHTQYEQSNAFGIGIGTKLSPRNRVEVVYRDLGRYNGFLSWQEPEKVQDNPATECIEPCTKTIWGFNTGTVRGLDISWARTYGPFTFSQGLFVYRSEFRHYRSDVNNEYARDYGLAIKSVSYGATPTVGAFVRYGAVEVGFSAFFEVPSDDICCSPWRSAYMLSITTRGKS